MILVCVQKIFLTTQKAAPCEGEPLFCCSDFLDFEDPAAQVHIAPYELRSFDHQLVFRLPRKRPENFIPEPDEVALFAPKPLGEYLHDDIKNNLFHAQTPSSVARNGRSSCRLFLIWHMPSESGVALLCLQRKTQGSPTK